jgi:hypothetical protein
MKNHAESVRMLVLFTSTPDADVIGLKAVPGRLPQVLRFPGESQKAMRHRALSMVIGSGPLLVYPMLRD